MPEASVAGGGGASFVVCGTEAPEYLAGTDSAPNPFECRSADVAHQCEDVNRVGRTATFNAPTFGGLIMPRTAMNLIDPAVRRCIDDCVRCHEICLSTVPYCLEQSGRHGEEAHITLLLDCAAICQTAADFMLRGSDEHARICAACAALCHRCAEDCDTFLDDDVMHACAESCRRCADSCDQMAAAHA